MFFPKRGGGQRKAKQICDECPVRAQCRDYAERTNTHYGIWGGEVLKRWGDNSPNADNEIGFNIDPILKDEFEVHAEECDLDEDCSCHVSLRELGATVPPLPGTVGNGQDLPICPPD